MTKNQGQPVSANAARHSILALNEIATMIDSQLIGNLECLLHEIQMPAESCRAIKERMNILIRLPCLRYSARIKGISGTMNSFISQTEQPNMEKASDTAIAYTDAANKDG